MPTLWNYSNVRKKSQTKKKITRNSIYTECNIKWCRDRTSWEKVAQQVFLKNPTEASSLHYTWSQPDITSVVRTVSISFCYSCFWQFELPILSTWVIRSREAVQSWNKRAHQSHLVSTGEVQCMRSDSWEVISCAAPGRYWLCSLPSRDIKASSKPCMQQGCLHPWLNTTQRKITIQIGYWCSQDQMTYWSTPLESHYLLIHTQPTGLCMAA